MQQSNVNTCPHGNHTHTITTSDGRTVFMCEQCHSGLLARLAYRSFIGLMIKSTLTSGEIARIGVELLDDTIRTAKDLPRCDWCNRSCYPNQLKTSEKMGGMVCDSCRADDGPDERFVEPVSLLEFPEVQPCQQ